MTKVNVGGDFFEICSLDPFATEINRTGPLAVKWTWPFFLQSINAT